MPRLSISSWSLHERLGRAWYEPDGAGGCANRSTQTPRIALIDVPAEAARHGIGTVELCHFHFPATDPDSLGKLRAALARERVELFSVLVDAGDISTADAASREADLRMIRRWIDVAACLGAACVRVVAGESEPRQDAVERSVDGLRTLARYAGERGVRILTENFRRLAARPEVCLRILDACGGQVGLCADFGNFPAASRERDLAAVLPRAESLHAKADDDGRVDEPAFQRLLRLASDAGFDGPASLIYPEHDEAWPGLGRLRDLAQQAWSAPAA